MSKTIHLISDLHLCEEQPHLLSLFEHYMLNIAPKSQQLFVLGDLFDVWLGDDDDSEFNQTIIELFAHYSKHHGELFFMHGNRDFLIGQTFVKQCGGQLLEEPYNFEWQDKKICLMHGDSLCIDDINYQEFRAMVRTKQWQNQFLGLSITERSKIASNIKQQSKDAQKQKTYEIMDVNSDAVKQSFIDNKNHWLIHGHTHREGSHQVEYLKGQIVTRIVLADWQQQGHYLELKNQQVKSHYFTLNQD